MTQLTGNNKASLALDNPTAAVAPARLADHLTLTKPRITFMVVVTAGIGFALAAEHGGPWSWLALVGTGVGTALACMGANALNQVLERKTDALMDRTKDRPLPAGRLTVAEALGAAVIYCIAGIAVLWVLGSVLAALLAAATIGAYAFVYTPLKRHSPVALQIGAIPGAMAPVIGAAAACGWIPPAGWLLFAIMFVWQVPHFLALAWLYRDDYAKASLAVLTVVDPTGERTFRHVLIGCLTLVPLGLLPTMMGVSGTIYFFCALICGLGLLGCGVALQLQASRGRARLLFIASLIYLPVLLAVMLIDKL